MKYQKKLLIIGLFMAISYLSACKKEQKIAAYDRPVVESYLIPGKALEVKVYYQKYLEDTTSYGYPITGLTLKVSDGSNPITLTETNPGTYTYADQNYVKELKSYFLNFSYLDKTISAQTTVPSKPVHFKASNTQQQVPTMTFGTTPATFVPVTFSWDNPALDYYLIAFQNVDASQSGSLSRNTSLRSEAIVGQVSSYNTERGVFNYTGNHKVLLFHINKEYNDALKSSGGNSLNLTNPSTNVVNGLGIFTALRADTLSLFVYQ